MCSRRRGLGARKVLWSPSGISDSARYRTTYTPRFHPRIKQLVPKRPSNLKLGEPSSTVESELHPNLRITDVRDASGRPLAFNRGDGDPLLVRVSLNDSVPVGQKVKLTFTYAGPLANEDAQPGTWRSLGMDRQYGRLSFVAGPLVSADRLPFQSLRGGFSH